MTCNLVYDGPSFPEEHGVTCFRPKGHDAGTPHGFAKHCGHSKVTPSRPLAWYSTEQKLAREREYLLIHGGKA